MRYFSIIPFICSLLLFSCGNDTGNGDAYNTDSERDLEEVQSQNQLSDTYTKEDSQFVFHVIKDDIFQVKTGRTALEEAQLDPVKNFAELMINEHSQSLEHITSLAEQNGINLPEDIEVREDMQSSMDSLNDTGGVQFDKKYVDVMVRVHEESINYHDEARDWVNSPSLRKFIDSNIVVLRDHLVELEDLVILTDERTGEDSEAEIQ